MRVRGNKITFKSTPRDQSNVTRLFAALRGRPEPKLCQDCGGVLPESWEGNVVPENAKCRCLRLVTK